MRYAFAFSVLLFVSSGVQAQTITTIRTPENAATQAVRIQVQMNISQRIAGNSIEDQRRAEETMRRSLYEMASHECALLSDVFKSDCKMRSLNVNSNNVERNETTYAINGSATGQFDLTSQP